MTWDQVLRSKGLRREKVPVPNPVGGTSCSMRITRRMRAIAYRDGDYLRIVSLHPDHDSANEG